MNFSRFMKVKISKSVILNRSLHRYTHMRAGKSGQREANLALVLCGIVAAFVLCHIPRVVLSIHEFILTEDIIR